MAGNVYPQGGGAPTSGLAQPAVDARIRALGEIHHGEVPTVGDLGTAGTTGAAKLYDEAVVTADGLTYELRSLPASNPANWVAKGGGTSISNFVMVDKTPGAIPADLAALTVAVAPGTQPAGERWTSIVGTAGAYRKAAIVGGAWVFTDTASAAAGIDDTLAVGQLLTADRTIDGDADQFSLILQALNRAETHADAIVLDSAGQLYFSDGAGNNLPPGHGGVSALKALVIRELDGRVYTDEYSPPEWVDVASDSTTILTYRKHKLVPGSHAAPAVTPDGWFTVKAVGGAATVTGLPGGVDGVVADDGSVVTFIEQGGAWVRLASAAGAYPSYTSTQISATTTAGVNPPGVYDPYHLRAWKAIDDKMVGSVENHDPTYTSYPIGAVVVGTDRHFHEALVANPTEAPTDVGQTQWKPVDLVPLPTVADNGRILRVVAGEYVLVDETQSAPSIQPSTAYLAGATVSAFWPVAEGGDDQWHRFLAPADRATPGTVVAGQMSAAELAAGSWQDLGASNAMVGATATVDGAAGEVPQPTAGQNLNVLTGAATYDYRPRYLGEVATFADLQALPDAQPGDEVHVTTAGINSRGATYKRLRAVTGTLSDWIKTAEVTNPATIDDTTTTIDTTTFDISVTA